jgi:hypothetical protein
MERRIITVASPESSGSSSFPIYAKFYLENEERNALAYKDGSVPFLLSLDTNRDRPEIAQLAASLAGGTRVPRAYIFDSFTVYKLQDQGVQSLSPGFEDFTVLCFTSSGNKIPQKDLAIIRNFTTKESFVLIPETLAVSGSVTFLVLPRRRTISAQVKQPLTKSGDAFTANLSDLEADSLDELAIFAMEGSTDYEITNSTDFVSLSRADAAINTLVAEQGGYFKRLQAGEAQSKTTLDSTATISIGILGSSAFAGTKQYNSDHYYGALTLINSSYSADISLRGIYELYEEIPGGLMKKLIQGKDFWIGSNGQLNVDGSTASKRYEAFVRKDRTRRIASSFDFSTGNSYDLHKALYYSYVADWKVDKANSRIRIYKDGLLVKTNDASGSYSEITFAAGTYEYVVEDYALTAVSTPTENTNTVTFHYSDSTVQSRVSQSFNKYQISTDPHLNTDGTSISPARTEQDIVLYTTNDGFLVHADEPRVTIGYTGSTATSFAINGITDPLTSLLPTVEGNYEDFQVGYTGSKTKVTFALHEDENVQDIEAQISQLKRNLGAILENSDESFTGYTGSTSAGQFLFLALKGTSGQSFDLVYREGSEIVKKEYNCTFDSNGRYLSVPFFSGAFNAGGSASVSFEVSRGSVSQYRIFR